MKSPQRLPLLFLLSSLCGLFSCPALAGDRSGQKFDCFSIVVGKNASADGSVMFAHNEDTGPLGVNYYKVPASSHKPGEEIVFENGGRIRQALKTSGYLWISIPGCDVCDGCINESGVAVGSDGCPSREENPSVTDGGILFWLRLIVAERARSAREGVKIAGGLIDEFGYASSGRSYVIADEDEAWILAAVNGKHWVAQRVPDDKVAVIPNCYTIQGVDLRDTANFLGSPDIVEHAKKRGWYDPSSDGEFNFAKAYSNPGSLTHPENVNRMWRAVELVSGRKYDRAQQLPFAVTPGAPLQVKDLMRMLRDHCEGTDLDKSADYTAGNPHRTNIGTICHDGTQYSFVAHLRPGLPAEIAPAIWIAMFHPDVQGYCPWYPSVTAVPPVYSSGDYTFGLRQQLDRSLAGKTKERSAAYTRFVSLNEKVHTNSAVNVPRIRKAWQSFEEEGFRKQAEFEKQFLSRQKADATTTTQMITDQTSARAIEVYENADALARSLD